MLGNVKDAIHGTYHSVREKHLLLYLAEFCHRFQLEDLFPQFVFVAFGHRLYRTVWQSGLRVTVNQVNIKAGLCSCEECVL